MSKSLSIRLADDLARRLQTMASETERSRAFHIQKALEAYLDEYADLQVALDRLQDQTDPIVSGKELRKSLGL